MVFVLTPERDGVAPPEAQLSEASPLLPRQPESSLPDDRKVTHPRAFFAFIFALLFTTGFAIVSVPSIAIYRHIVCRTDYTNLGAYIRHGLSDERCLTDAISSKVSELIGLDGLITFSTALCTVLGYGRMADTYGGKPPLYIATSCSILALLWTVLVVSKASVWNYKFVLVGSVIAGLGGFAPSLRMSVNSIVCDCYHGESRLIAMSYMIAANLVAAIWAPAIGGWLLQIGLLWPLWGGICLLLCYLVALSFLPETHPRLQFERSEILRGGETTTLTNDESMYDSLDKPSASTVVLVFQTCWETISVMTIFLRGRNFALLGLIAFITKFDTQILIVVMQFLTKQLKWSVTVVGYYYASLHAGQLIVLLVILPLFTRFMRARVPRHLLDIWMVKSGLLFNTLAFLGYGVMSDRKILPIISIFQALAVSLGPSSRVLTSNLVSADEIGTLYSAFSMVEGIGSLAGLPALSYTYLATLSSYAGLAFIIVAVLYFSGRSASMFLRDADLADSESIQEEQDV